MNDWMVPYLTGQKVLGGGPTIESDQELDCRADRKRKVWVFRHKPTDIEIEIEMPPGLTRKELERHRQQSFDNLRGALDSMVRFHVAKQLKHATVGESQTRES